jgi:hypothetical protein
LSKESVGSFLVFLGKRAKNSFFFACFFVFVSQGSSFIPSLAIQSLSTGLKNMFF